MKSKKKTKNLPHPKKNQKNQKKKRRKKGTSKAVYPPRRLKKKCFFFFFKKLQHSLDRYHQRQRFLNRRVVQRNRTHVAMSTERNVAKLNDIRVVRRSGQMRAAETAISRRLGPFCLRAYSCNNVRRRDESRWSRRQTLTTHSAQQIEDVPVSQIVEEKMEFAHIVPLERSSSRRADRRRDIHKWLRKSLRNSRTQVVSCERAPRGMQASWNASHQRESTRYYCVSQIWRRNDPRWWSRWSLHQRECTRYGFLQLMRLSKDKYDCSSPSIVRSSVCLWDFNLHGDRSVSKVHRTCNELSNSCFVPDMDWRIHIIFPLHIPDHVFFHLRDCTDVVSLSPRKQKQRWNAFSISWKFLCSACCLERRWGYLYRQWDVAELTKSHSFWCTEPRWLERTLQQSFEIGRQTHSRWWLQVLHVRHSWDVRIFAQGDLDWIFAR